MTKALAAFKRVSLSMERGVERLIERHEARVTDCIRKQLLDWKARYPRHNFEAWEAHGMLSFCVSPEVNGEKYVESLSGRGAIALLQEEAEQFISVYCEEWKVCLVPSESIINI